MVVVAVVCTVGPVVLARLTRARHLQPFQRRLTKQNTTCTCGRLSEVGGLRERRQHRERASGRRFGPRVSFRLSSFSFVSSASPSNTFTTASTSRTQISSEVSTDAILERARTYELLRLPAATSSGVISARCTNSLDRVWPL